MDDDAMIARMRSRLNRVHFATPHGLVEISWTSRQLLLELLRADGWAKEVTAIEAVGVSAPVMLEEPMGRTGVMAVIVGATRTGELPADLLALSEALKDA